MDLDENGVLSERTPDAGSESFLDNSLLDRLYPGIKACRIKACEGMCWRPFSRRKSLEP